MEMKFEARPKQKGHLTGDFEVWRSITESNRPEQLIATFHNYTGDGLSHIAMLNANTYAKERNDHEAYVREMARQLPDAESLA